MRLTTNLPSINSISSLLFVLAGLVIAQQGFAQSQYETASDSDPAAMELLDAISNNYKKQSAHKINFSLDIELPAQGMETQKGMLIQSGDKFVLSMEGRKIISNGETVWMYLKDMNEVQINDADFEEAAEFTSPSDIFSMHKSGKYVFALSSRLTEDGKAVTQIEGKPLDDDSEYSKMRLTVIDAGKQVKRLKIFSKDGSRFTMHIADHDDKYRPTEDEFSFNPSDYEGVHVEDLRF